jgi:hypothetical protein
MLERVARPLDENPVPLTSMIRQGTVRRDHVAQTGDETHDAGKDLG